MSHSMMAWFRPARFGGCRSCKKGGGSPATDQTRGMETTFIIATMDEANARAQPGASTSESFLNVMRALELGPQAFSGNPLDRTQDAKRRFDSSTGSHEEVCLVVVAGRELCVKGIASPEAAEARGVENELQVLLLAITDPNLDLNSDFMSFLWSETDEYETALRLPLYLLGQDVMGRWTFALDISGPAKAGFLRYLRNTCGLEVDMSDLRGVMSTLSRDACAMAGHAAALSQWHLTHRYCSRCGTPTMPTEAGLRRRCEKDHKLYPRTDPVVIMLVESPDGRRALLGRSRKFSPGMYSCLSGFIDQCESIEEAVRREVREEARVAVADVQIIGSQPWPIGRYGSCELMLGCMAKAMSYEIMINAGEMEDVQWYDRAELASAVNLFDSLDIGSTVAEIQQQSMDTLGFFVPPPLAIAHHLIRLWAQNPGPWFPPVTQLLPTPIPAAVSSAGGKSQGDRINDAAGQDVVSARPDTVLGNGHALPPGVVSSSGAAVTVTRTTSGEIKVASSNL